MNLETFKDVLDAIKALINVDDEELDPLLKSAVNHAYIKDLSKIDKRISTAFAPVINGSAQLPDDLLNIESITPVLLNGERRLGNAILSSRDTMFTIVYSSTREMLVEDDDSIDLSQKLRYLLVTYGCYKYFIYRKKRDIAESYLNDYMLALREEQNDEDNVGEESVTNVYARSGGED